MKLKAVSGIMLTLFLIGMSTLTFNIQLVKTSGTTYIRADGSIDPDRALVSTVDNVIYTLTVPALEYPWQTFHHDNRRTGYTESPAPNSNRTLWSYTTGDEVTSSPTVADGTVFIGSHDSNVYALDATTGALIWSYTTGAYPVASSGATVAEGVVYIGSNTGKLYALNATNGDLIWSYTTGGAIQSSPAVVGDKVYIGMNRDVLALDSTTGGLIWSYATGGFTGSSPAVVNDKLFIGSGDRNVYALNVSTGEKIWNYTTGYDVVTSPALAYGMLYIASRDAKIYALNETTGSLIWSYATEGEIEQYMFSSPAVADGIVFIGSQLPDKKVYALNATTGALIWSYTTGGAVWSSPAVADGKVFIGSLDNKLYALNKSTGTLIWSYMTEGWVQSSPSVADGKVFIGSYDGKVYAFGPTACMHELSVGNYIEYEYNFTGTFVGEMEGTARAEVIKVDGNNYTVRVDYSPTDGSDAWTETDSYLLGEDFMCPLTMMWQAEYVADETVQTKVGTVNVARYTTGIDDAIYVHKESKILVLRTLNGQTVMEITDTDIEWLIDTTSPDITDVSQFPFKNNVLPEDEVKVNATVTDDLSGVKQVTLNYNSGNGTWTTVNMTNLGGNIWNATIPAFPYGTNVTYVVIAQDNAGNTITTEEMGFDCQYHVIPEFPSFIILPLFMIATLLAVIVYRRKHTL